MTTDKDYICKNGDKFRCPNMKADENDTSMETERYKCDICGQTYKLYYEDMK